MAQMWGIMMKFSFLCSSHLSLGLQVVLFCVLDWRDAASLPQALHWWTRLQTLPSAAFHQRRCPSCRSNRGCCRGFLTQPVQHICKKLLLWNNFRFIEMLPDKTESSHISFIPFPLMWTFHSIIVCMWQWRHYRWCNAVSWTCPVNFCWASV